MKTYTFDKAPSFTPPSPQIPGITAQGIDYNRLINRP